MKKSIIIAFLLLTATLVKAQVWVGGQVNITKGKSDAVDGLHTKTRVFKFLPEVGYVLNDKWDLAVSIGVDYSHAKLTTGGKKRRSAFVLEPYARYKVYENGTIGFFVDGGLSVENGDFFYNGTYYKSETMYGVGIRPGVKYNATDNLSFVATFGGLGVNHVQDETNVGFNFNGNALTVGAYYTFK